MDDDSNERLTDLCRKKPSRNVKRKSTRNITTNNDANDGSNISSEGIVGDLNLEGYNYESFNSDSSIETEVEDENELIPHVDVN